VSEKTGHLAKRKRGKPFPRTLYLIKQLQYKTYVRLEDALRPLGITSAQFRIMTTLRDHARRSSAELSRMFGVKPQTIIKQIAILENRGLVARSVAANNKRVLSNLAKKARGFLP
jgi:DNA-binding MarR family transcriptional regulator